MLNSKFHKHLHVKTYHVIYHKKKPLYKKNTQNQDMYALRSLEIDLIFLLVPTQCLFGVLEQTITTGVTDSTALWVIPSYHESMATSLWNPDKLLSFEFEDTNRTKLPYNRLHKGLTESLKIYSHTYRYIIFITG